MSVVTRPDLFPAGTTVKFFAVPALPVGELVKNNAGDPETWKPTLVKTGSAVVASDGSLTVQGTVAGQVLCWASVSSKDVYLTAFAEGGAGEAEAKTTSSQILAANPYRTGLAVENRGPTNVVYLGLGTAAVLGQGVGPIVVNGSWDGRVSGTVWKGAVFAIAETGAVKVSYQEV